MLAATLLPHLSDDLLDARELIAATTSSDDVEKTKPAPDIFATALEKLLGIDPSDGVRPSLPRRVTRRRWRLCATASQPRHIAICVADVSDMAAVERITTVAVDTFGGFDSWVNNSGTGTYGTLEQVSVDDHRCVFDVNYFGVLHGSLVAALHLRERAGARGGAIINIGSILSDRAIVEQAVLRNQACGPVADRYAAHGTGAGGGGHHGDADQTRRDRHAVP